MKLPNLDEIMPEKKEVEVPLYKSNLTAEYEWPECTTEDTEFIDDWLETGWIGTFHLDMVLSLGLDLGASDCHLASDRRVAYSVLGDIHFEEDIIPLDEEEMTELVQKLLSNEEYGEFLPEKRSNVSYTIRFGPYAGTRFRLNVGISLDGEILVFRHLQNTIPTLSELGVEQELVKWFEYPNGLIFICGSTGTGKSTTLASLIRDFQIKRPRKIVTIERPIEYLFPDNGRGYITQREVGRDVLSYEHGLEDSLRQAPDIIQIGEVRSKNEVGELIKAADTGHLAISTMHTNSVPTTINRIQSLFEGSERAQILNTLSTTLRGMANQVLIKDGKGSRVAVREILTITEEVRPFIANGDAQGLEKYMRDRKMTMEDKMVEGIKAKKFTASEARQHTSNWEYLDLRLKEAGLI